jgi:heme/copper-type cytochrome/quinol oxidase subunit 2
MTKEHQGQVEECKAIFCSWSWMVAIILGAISVLAVGVYSYATSETKQDNLIDSHETRLEKCEKTLIGVTDANTKLDTLLKRVIKK